MVENFATNHLTIRKLQMTDFDDYYRLISYPEVAAETGFSLIGNQKMIEEAVKGQLQAPRSFGLYLADQLIGAVLFFTAIGEDHLPDPFRVEMSYFLEPTYWHQGLMTEALTEILAQLPTQITVTAAAFSDNLASIALLKKLDFKQETQIHDPISGRDKLLFISSQA